MNWSIQTKEKLSSSNLKAKINWNKHNYRISGQKIEIAEQTKCLGIYLDKYLTWNFQNIQTKSKLSRISDLLAKLRYYLKPGLLWTIYFEVFDSILEYRIQIWEQNKGNKVYGKNSRKKNWILSFKWKCNPVNPLFKNSKNSKKEWHVNFYMMKLMKFSLGDFFTTSENHHPYNTTGRKSNTIVSTQTITTLK